MKFVAIISFLCLVSVSSIVIQPVTNVPFHNDSGKIVFSGKLLQVSPNVVVYVPPQVCKPENCPPPFGQCTSKTECTYRGGYDGLRTHPFGYVTHYCKLNSGGCSGVTQVNLAHVTAGKISTDSGLPLCENAGMGQKCIGIVALSPIMMGNSQLATDPETGLMVHKWGMGLTEASGFCYELAGPGGPVVVAVTDRCAGYCTCTAMKHKGECAPCLNELAEGGKVGLTPGCPCVGTAPKLHSQCCGMSDYGCPTLDGECDWCANSNHPQFDVDDDAFFHVCGAEAGRGSCKLSSARVVKCAEPLKWPPGGTAGGCGANAYSCSEASAPEMPKIEGCGCCCNWGFKPTGKKDECACTPSKKLLQLFEL